MKSFFHHFVPKQATFTFSHQGYSWSYSATVGFSCLPSAYCTKWSPPVPLHFESWSFSRIELVKTWNKQNKWNSFIITGRTVCRTFACGTLIFNVMLFFLFLQALPVTSFLGQTWPTLRTLWPHFSQGTWSVQKSSSLWTVQVLCTCSPQHFFIIMMFLVTWKAQVGWFRHKYCVVINN